MQKICVTYMATRKKLNAKTVVLVLWWILLYEMFNLDDNDNNLNGNNAEIGIILSSKAHSLPETYHRKYVISL